MTYSPTPPVIYVDIDDTLIRSFGSKRIPMTPMVERVKELKDAGATLYCWSSGGAEYARSSATELGIESCFTGFLPKPDILLDDMRLQRWRIREYHPNECLSLSIEQLLVLP